MPLALDWWHHVAILLTEGGGAWSNLMGLIGFSGLLCRTSYINREHGWIHHTLRHFHVRNGILADQPLQLLNDTKKMFLFDDAILRGSIERLAPILHDCPCVYALALTSFSISRWITWQ